MKVKGAIKTASTDTQGNTKPSVFFLGDNMTGPLFYLEGIEGYHKTLSSELSEENGKPKAIYLNHGYFKIKPDFVLMQNENTSDPQPKIDKNGCLSGVFEVYDVQNKIDAVLWCYTQPKNRALWERLRTQIDFSLNQMKHLGVNKLDANGYLPAVFKIGKIPSRFGAKYAKVVSWDISVCIISGKEFDQLDHELARTTYENFPPRLANEFETSEGPTITLI